MTKGLYIVAAEPQSGKSLLSFCLIRLFQHHFPHVGFYRPITTPTQSEDINDPHISAASSFFGFSSEQSAHMSGVPIEQAEQWLKQGQHNTLLTHIIERYKNIESHYDIIISEGCDFRSHPNILEFDLNAEIANNLNCQLLVVINGHDKTLKAIETDVSLTLRAYQQKHCQLFGIIINRVVSVQVPALKSQLTELFGTSLPFFGIVPENDFLSKPNMSDIAQHLHAEVCWGASQLNRVVHQPLIAAKHVCAFLTANYAQHNTLVVSPGDRIDILMGCLLAEQSEHYPPIAGMVLTTGVKPPATISRILDGLATPFPILSTPEDTFSVAASLHKAHFATAILHHDKIQHAINHVTQSIDEKALMAQLQRPHTPRMTPYMFEYFLEKTAQQNLKHIVLAEGEDLRILKAAERLLKRQCVRLTLLGRQSVIEKLLQTHLLSLPDINIIDPATSELTAQYAEQHAHLRKHKGMNLDIAKDLMLTTPYFATTMLSMGDCDGMVCGAQHTTGDTIRPALQIIKTQPGVQRVSSLFVMCLQHRMVIYADCAINPDPDADTLAETASLAAQTAQKLGLSPKIAMLSYSSGDSGHGARVDKVRQATQILSKMHPEFDIEGPIQYDAAVDADVSSKKLPTSTLNGQANVLIFPDLDTGNNTYKAVARESGALAIGPILLGLKKPVNDLSRGCHIDDIVNTVLITAIQAAERA